MKYLLFGIVLSVIGVLLSYLLWGIEKIYLITGGFAVLFIGLAVVLSGSLGSGDRLRVHCATESAEDRSERISTTFRLLLLGIPNMAVSIFLFYFIKKYV